MCFEHTRTSKKTKKKLTNGEFLRNTINILHNFIPSFTTLVQPQKLQKHFQGEHGGLMDKRDSHEPEQYAQDSDRDELLSREKHYPRMQVDENLTSVHYIHDP